MLQSMFAIVGILIVIAAVVGGYLMEHGHMMVLLQPAELLIISGAALGTILIANPIAVLKALAAGFLQTFKGSRHGKALYTDTLTMFFDLFQAGRRQGLAGLETHVEDPANSDLFKKHPQFFAEHHALLFVCDTLRMAISGSMSPFDMDQMMESDIEVHHKIQHQPIAALSTMADALPGLGIVAAVLGVVITMGSLGGPPEEIGHKVAAALVGTFLGILMCYGFFGPIASNMSGLSEMEGYYFNCLRVTLVAFLKGVPPILAVEFGRRVVPAPLRLTFQELESACRGEPKAEETKAVEQPKDGKQPKDKVA